MSGFRVKFLRRCLAEMAARSTPDQYSSETLANTRAEAKKEQRRPFAKIIIS